MIIKFVSGKHKMSISPKAGCPVEVIEFNDLWDRGKKNVIEVIGAKNAEDAKKVNPCVCFIDYEFYALQEPDSSLFIMSEQTGQTIDKLW